MTPREELIAFDRDSLEQQVIHLEQKLESAQFERDQERARAEKAEAACAEMREALARSKGRLDTFSMYGKSAQTTRIVEHALSTDAGKSWLSPEKAKVVLHSLLEIKEWRDSAEKEWLESIDISHPSPYIEEAIAALKESQ